MKHVSGPVLLVILAACSPKEAPKPEPLGPISEVEIVSSLCPPKGYDQASVLALKDAWFELPDASERQAFAIKIVDCLSNPRSGAARWRRGGPNVARETAGTGDAACADDRAAGEARGE